MILRSLLTLTPLALPASAATVLLANGDFSTGTNPDATGWTRVNGSGTNSPPSTYAEAVPGATWGRSMQLKSDGGNYFQQALGATDLGLLDASTFGTFTVDLDYGYRRDSGATSNTDHTIRISIWNLSENVELAGQNLTLTNSGSGTNSLSGGIFHLNYDNTLASLAGDAIALRFTSTSSDLGGNAWTRTAMIDNVAVTATPEPGGALAGLLCALGLFHRRR